MRIQKKSNRVSKEINKAANLPLYKYTFWGLIAIIGIWLIVSSLAVGIPSDEPIDDAYGKSALQYYKTFGKDTSYVNLTVHTKKFKLQKYYGAGFEMPAAAMASLFPKFNRYKIRHILVTICGLIMFIFIGLTSRLLLGWAAACIAVVLLLASPTMIGNMLFNSKDIPFTLGFIIASYFFIKFAKEMPSLRLGTLAGMSLGIAGAVSIRIGGILLLAYLLFLLVTKFSLEKTFRKKLLEKGVNGGLKIAGSLFFVSMTGVLMGLLFYPNFIEYPLEHVNKALGVASNFPAKIIMLFEGKMINSLALPPYYLFKSLWITLPVFVFIAILVTLLFIPKIIKQTGATNFSFLVFTAVFPIAYIYFSNSAIYNGWRHILFFYPPLVIILSVALCLIFIPFRKKPIQIVLLVVFALAVAKPLLWQVKNSPYQYTYFNEMVGGFSDAYGNYDDDYQQIATSQAAKWLIDHESIFKKKDRKKITIISNNANSLNDYFDGESLNIKFKHSGIKQWKNADWDYAVISNIFITPKIRNLVFPPKDLLHTVSIDGKDIAYVIKRRDRNNYEGYKYIQEKNYNEAFLHLSKAYKYDPNNFNTWLNLAFVYNAAKNGPEMIRYTKKYYELYPSDWQANQLMGIGYFYMNEYAKAESYIIKALKIKSHKNLYLILEKIYSATGDTKKLNKIQQKLKTIK